MSINLIKYVTKWIVLHIYWLQLSDNISCILYYRLSLVRKVFDNKNRWRIVTTSEIIKILVGDITSCLYSTVTRTAGIDAPRNTKRREKSIVSWHSPANGRVREQFVSVCNTDWNRFVETRRKREKERSCQ